MPEYLAPGVYVEEVDTGAKPIEGVSTSTCGMVGVSERGPIGVPVLVTSVGEFTRWYGGQLRQGDDYYGQHRYLPHAVEGFFDNGGKRAYVVRALSDAATKAASALFDRGDATAVSTALLRAGGEASGSAAMPPPLVVLPVGAINVGAWLRIGDGSNAEYRRAAGNTDPETVVVAVDLPLARSHANTEHAIELARAPGDAFTTTDQVDAGAEYLVLQGTSAHATTLETDVRTNGPGAVCVEIGAAGTAEYRIVRQVSSVTSIGGGNSTARLHLDAPLTADYPGGTAVTRIDLTGGAVQDSMVESANAGSAVFFVGDRNGNFTTRADLVMVGDNEAREVRRIGELSTFAVEPGAAENYPAGTLVEAVQFPPDRTLAADPGAGDTSITLQAHETDGLVVGQRIVIDPGGAPETVTITGVTSNSQLAVTALPGDPNAGDTVVPADKQTTATAVAGSRVVALDDRMGITAGTLLRVGAGATQQYLTVTSVPASSGAAPDPGNVVFAPGLSADLAPHAAVTIVGRPQRLAGRQATALALPATAGATDLYVSDGDSFVAADMIQIATDSGDQTYYALTSNAAAVAARLLTLQTALARSHPAGSQVVGRKELIDIEALDAGMWGNRLRISVSDDNPGLVSRTTLDMIVNPTTVRLASRSGVQPGTVLEVRDAATGALLGDPVNVRGIDRATGNVLLGGAGLAPPQRVQGSIIRSREFTITVSLLRQPDPATPSRDSQIIDREVFRNLSLDPRHSNYVESVIGSIDGPLRKWDRRPEGASLYIRVRDTGSDAAKITPRLGPETLVDTLPDGRTVPALMRLETTIGDDAIAAIGDADYLGADNADPDLRTGLQSLRNVEEVSLVAIPGRVSAALQQGVIDHCELMRYRFAVLDSRPEPTDTISDAQDQRQQFDTKYAAIYYPWLTIPDPFPANLADVHDYPIPPAGHMLGVFARTDIDRGVHKAPANEVVRGITGLRRKVNKEQQDILNPYPVNVNVIRDFRDNNRGIRVYGGRVITSDPDWKYVNVRRLMIFIEASIERGLQWVVFEPNSEPLWARVRRTITNFLTGVWRDGALEGTAPEEAFFVRCDRTTMTQTDIDNGRLIIQVGVAPVKPAEFVIVRIGLWTARADT